MVVGKAAVAGWIVGALAAAVPACSKPAAPPPPDAGTPVTDTAAATAQGGGLSFPSAQPSEPSLPPIASAASPNARSKDASADAESLAQRNARLTDELERMNLRPIAGGPGPGLTSTPVAPVGTGPPTGIGDRGPDREPGAPAKGEVVWGAITAPAAIAGAEAALAPVRPRVKACYLKGLATTPTLAGKVLLRAKVETTGAVSRVDVAFNTGLDDDVMACVSKAIASTKFAAPTEAGDVGVSIAFGPAK